MTERALIGINPDTKICEIVGIDNLDTVMEIWRSELILVAVSKSKAKNLWLEVVPDIYALSKQST